MSVFPTVYTSKRISYYCSVEKPRIRLAEVLRLLNTDENAATVVSGFQNRIPRDSSDAEIGFVLGEYHGFARGLRSGFDTAISALGDEPAAKDKITSRLHETLEVPEAEIDRVLNLLGFLAKSGELHSFHRCANPTCNRWMYARRADQAFCTARCRHKCYARSELAKVRRNQRNRYRYQMRRAVWQAVAVEERPSFEKWLKYKAPTPREWQYITKGRIDL
jgi:hypothetical protein